MNNGTMTNNLCGDEFQMPQAIDLEEALLGTLITDNDAYWHVCDLLHFDMFYIEKHQIIYAAIEHLERINAHIDSVIVLKYLETNNSLEKIGGEKSVKVLIEKAVAISKLEDYANIILNKHQKRKLIALASQIQMDVNADINIEEYISNVKDELIKIAKPATVKGCTQINSLIAEAYNAIQKAAVDGFSGLKTGFKDLDKLICGWQKGDLITIGARPAMGKSAFIISMLKNMAIKYKIPVALFSLETTKAQVTNRLISNICEISDEKLRNGMLADYEWKQLDYKLKDLYDAPFHIDDTSIMQIDDICEKARWMVKEQGVKLIVIDYIQLLYNHIHFVDNGRYPDINYFTRKLKSLAKELNIPIIVLSEMNRNFELRNNSEEKRPQLTDLRDSGTLCDDSDIVILIHRPEYYKIYTSKDGSDLRGMAELIIAKHRNGAERSVKLKFIPQYVKFSDFDDEIVISSSNENIYTSRINSQNKDNPFSFGSEGPLPF